VLSLLAIFSRTLIYIVIKVIGFDDFNGFRKPPGHVTETTGGIEKVTSRSADIQAEAKERQSELHSGRKDLK